MRRLVVGAVALALVAGVVAAAVVLTGTHSYRLEILMPTATGVVPGHKVLVGGHPVGTVDDVRVHANRDALVTVRLDDDVAPLHQGTDARIVWDAVLLERVLQLVPGPERGPVLESGARIVTGNERVELDDLLAALDPDTMRQVNGMMQQLSTTLAGSEGDVAATVRTAAPTVEALGEVLRAVGDDGPALRSLVTQVRQVTDTLTQRRDQVSGTVTGLAELTAEIAAEQEALGRTVERLPATLAQARVTLDRVPEAVEQAGPLLDDLAPATAQLPEAAAQLDPVLRDLAPVARDLRPVAVAASGLLDRTPALLDGARDALPPTTSLVADLGTPIAFLRPYIPEATGWLANWTGVFGNETTTGGNYARILATTGTSAFNDNPGVAPPGTTLEAEPLPGSMVGQPWVDAAGQGQR